MSTSLVDADTLVAIDVGEVNTRAMLFDVVDGRYRFTAVGAAPSTANAPFHDVGEGVRMALDRLQQITGRTLIGGDERIIVPSDDDGNGVDTVVTTISAGPPLKVVVLGLLDNISLESAVRLASTTYTRVVDTHSLNDRRKEETRIDALLRLRPNLIVAAGGTEGGASQSVLKLLEAAGLACYLLPENQRPLVLFAGNQALQEELKRSFSKFMPLYFAPNLRPDLEYEQLDAAQSQLANLYRTVRMNHLTGVKEMDDWSGGGLLPTATAFGRVVRYLSKVYGDAKGVMGVDIGASASTLAAAHDGNLVQRVFPHLGLGRGLNEILDYTTLEDIRRWLAVEVPDSYLQEYMLGKAMYPSTLPATDEDMAIEEALARQAMRLAVHALMESLPAGFHADGSGLLPGMEPIIASGSVLTRAASPGHSMLMLLDGLQPTGITTLALDKNHIFPALGAAAAVNPILGVQVIESSTLENLGTVISPVSSARAGTPILRIKMTYGGGNETSYEIRQGSLEVLPLPYGQTANLQVTPLHRSDIGMGAPGRGGGVRVTGGLLGVVVDARGRPLILPDEPIRRRDLFKKWLWTLGG